MAVCTSVCGGSSGKGSGAPTSCRWHCLQKRVPVRPAAKTVAWEGLSGRFNWAYHARPRRRQPQGRGGGGATPAGSHRSGRRSPCRRGEEQDRRVHRGKRRMMTAAGGGAHPHARQHLR